MDNNFIGRYKDIQNIASNLPRSLKLGIQLTCIGQYYLAELFCQKALLELCPSGHDNPVVAIIYDVLALIYKNQNKEEESIKYLYKALHTLQKTLKGDNLLVADVLNNLAFMYRKRKEYKEAEECYLAAAEVMERVLGPNHDDVQKQLKKLSLFTKETRKYEVWLYQPAVQIFKKLVGSECQSTAPKLKTD